MQEQEVCPIFLKISPADIVWMIFLVESYDGLGVVRTLDAERGEIVILALSDTVQTLRALLDSVTGEFEFREIPPGESLKGDWLLAEMVGTEPS